MKTTITTPSILSALDTPEERVTEFQPRSFDEYLGQEVLKSKLLVYTQAAFERQEPLDHLLLFGPPGLGKTTLAQIMAHVMCTNITICSGPTLERSGDLVALLTGLKSRDILFIDEIHRMPIVVEELLYTAMEQYKVDVILGQGAGAQAVALPLNPFTLIGATTKPALLSAPLRTRFGIIERLDFYTENELATIVEQNIRFLKLTITSEAALIIARCSRGTPRITKKIVRRVRDYAQVYKKELLDKQVIEEALRFLGIDHEGLTVIDHALLHAITCTFKGGPVGVETLASLVGEDKSTLEEVYEPFLLRKGYIEKTSRGRAIPAGMLARLRLRYRDDQDKQSQQSLFAQE